MKVIDRLRKIEKGQDYNIYEYLFKYLMYNINAEHQ